MEPDAVVLTVPGPELDAATAPAAVAAVREAIETATSGVFVADLSAVEFLDSSGLRALVTLRSLVLDRGGSLSLRGVGPTPERVLRMTGLLSVLPVVE